MKALAAVHPPYPPTAGGGSESELALARVGIGLRRLRAAGTVPALFSEAAELICEVVGFERAAVFRLRGHVLFTESTHARGQSSHDEHLRPRPSADRFSLGPWLHESEVLRRQRAALVKDVAGDPRALRMLPGSQSYVVAPVACQSRAVGLIHADRGTSGADVSELDRDAVTAFAEGFGCALERGLLAERLRSHSKRLVELMRSTEESVTELAELQNELPIAAAEEALAGGGDILPTRPPSELTPREVEVLAMLAKGETNARIAGALVVSEGTVKTHVKHILRKLGVQNRSQAVACYFRGLAPEMPPGGEKDHPFAGRRPGRIRS